MKNLASEDFRKFLTQLMEKQNCHEYAAIRDILTDCAHYADYLDVDIEEIFLDAEELAAEEKSGASMN